MPAVFCTEYETGLFAVGRLTLTSDGGALTGCWFEGGHRGRGNEDLVKRDGLAVFDSACCWLDRYFAGGRPLPDELPLRPAGSEFRQLVWAELRRIPYGQTVCYGDIARAVEVRTGRRTCAQAIGGAVGHNPLGVIVPCHRVVGADGSLTGFAGGLDVKAALLCLEGVGVEGAGQMPTCVARVCHGS